MQYSDCYETVFLCHHRSWESKRGHHQPLPAPISTSQESHPYPHPSPVGLKLVWIMCFPDKRLGLEHSQCLQRIGAEPSVHVMPKNEFSPRGTSIARELSSVIADTFQNFWERNGFQKQVPLRREVLGFITLGDRQSLVFPDLGSREFLPLHI